MKIKKPLWACPVCKRKFAKARQWHSCLARSIESHFKGKPPELKKTFDYLISQMKRFGPLRVDAVKSSINLIAKHHFGGITVQKQALRLGFLLNRPVKHPRIVKVTQIMPNAIGHRVFVSTKKDVDKELLAWLKQAYDLRK